MSAPRDPLDDLLTAEAAPASADLSERLRAETTRVVRRRRLARRLTQTAAAACLLVVALGVLWVWFAVRTAMTPHPQARRQAPPPAPTTQETPPAPPALKEALALEWQAFESAPDERSARYLEAGNEYIAQGDDYEAALRCYRQALDTGGAAALAIDPDDNWLVMAIKLDRQKER